MARTQVEAQPEKRQHTVKAKFIPLFGVEFHDYKLRAFTCFGRTPEEAARNARNTIQHHLPRKEWDISIEYLNPETFEKAGVTLEPEY